MREAGDELLAPLRRLLKQLNFALQLFRLLAAAFAARRAPLSPQRKKRNEPAARREASSRKTA